MSRNHRRNRPTSFFGALFRRFSGRALPSSSRAARHVVESVWAAVRWVFFLVVLVTINLYVFYFRPGTSVPSLIQATQQETQARGVSSDPFSLPTARPIERGEKNVVSALDYSYYRELRIGGKNHLNQLTRQTLLSKDKLEELTQILVDEGVGEEEHPFPLVLYFDRMDRWLALDVRIDESYSIRIRPQHRLEAGPFLVQKLRGPWHRELEVVAGTIPQGGTWTDALPQGESRSLLQGVIDIFAYERDLQTQYHDGDAFQVVVEKLYQGDHFLRYGKIAYAKIISKEEEKPVLTALWFKSSEQPGYYTDKGRSLRRGFRRSPVWLATALNEGWVRKDLLPEWYPKKNRAESFAIYPAPPKTPVRAMFSGTLQLCPKEMGCIWMLKNKEHEMRFYNLNMTARGVRSGMKVSAGQVIGYVGLAAVGKKAHLKVSLWNQGKTINPIAGYSPREPSIPKVEIERFEQTVQSLQDSVNRGASLTGTVVHWLRSL